MRTIFSRISSKDLVNLLHANLPSEPDKRDSGRGSEFAFREHQMLKLAVRAGVHWKVLPVGSGNFHDLENHQDQHVLIIYGTAGSLEEAAFSARTDQA